MANFKADGLPHPSFVMDDGTSLVLESITDAFISLDADLRLTYVNAQAEAISGKKREELLGKKHSEAFPESVGTVFEDAHRSAIATRQKVTVVDFYAPKDAWIEVDVFPLINGGLALYFRDVTERKRMEIMISSQKKALELALAGHSLSAALDELLLAIERQAGRKIFASIMLLDDEGEFLESISAPTLSQTYCKAIDGTLVGENIGTCGRAAALGQLAVTPSIADDPNWEGFHAIAEAEGLRAVWSMPILSSRNKVLGTFGVYYSEPRAPSDSDLRVAETLSSTAAIIIERHQENLNRSIAEQALRYHTDQTQRQRRLYEAALSNTPDLVYIFDLKHRFIYANAALLAMWGRTWDDAIGKTCLELGYEPWHAEMHDREIEQVVATKKPIRGDVPFNGTNGRRIYDYIFVPVLGKNGEVEAVAGTTRDVTERKEAEETLRKAEEWQRAALEASHSFGIWDWDIPNNKFTADARFGALFSLSAEEARNGVPLEKVVERIHPEDLPRIKSALDAAMEKGGRYHEEYRVVLADGSIRWVSAKGHVQLGPDGRAIRFPGAGVDITLEREATDALREADQKKDEFLATLAHELRNPLAPIRNALFVLRSGNADPETATEAQEVIERQINQMVHLVDDLLDVSRITRGKIELRRDVISIADVIQSAVEIAQPLIQERRHRIHIDLPEMPVRVDGDAVRLSQVFANLLNNAAKYTEPGGTIRLTAESVNGEARISLTDSGIGIAADMIPHIFDMFRQIDSSIERSQGGLGIGLTLVKRLVDLHGGRIEAVSAGLNQGSTFTVFLPLTDRAAQEGEAGRDLGAPAAMTTARDNLLALVVDDNTASGQTMGWTMEMLGFRVEVAHKAEAALEAAARLRPDVVLLDIGMPDMNGYDLCAAMRGLPGMDKAVFIAQTGWGQEEHRRRSKEAGFHHHLVKPIDWAVLQSILQARLDAA